MTKYKEFLGLGIAGNFALHLAQAGELEEFKNIITEDEAAPKGLFPFYLPYTSAANAELHSKAILTTYPLSSDTIRLPKEAVNVQAEPEVALICDLQYCDAKISKITPVYFAAYNDCSIRIAGADKISDKKNWGAESKGLSKTLIAIDNFSEGGITDDYSICSFLKRDGEVHAYGEDVELKGYSYFYKRLLDWILKQINTQKDFGPLEAINDYIAACDYPKKAIISIGATRYTEYGEHTFLRSNDEIVVTVYNAKKITANEVQECVKKGVYDDKVMSVLSQKAI
ncbi:MAG: DUF5718 family protein [Psychromonas sp.]|nr:DUF5718 family protein [Psychromonas sp.]